MYVTIIGGGTVGTSIAETLVQRNVNVTLLDSRPEALALAEEKLDVQIALGNGCDAASLFRAGVPGCDLCLALTSRDETNLCAASIAKAMGARRVVARVFDPAFQDLSTFDYLSHYGIDRLLSLERLTALEIAKSLHAPGMYAVENFARGGVQVQEVKVDSGSRYAGLPLKDVGLPPGVRCGLVARPGRAAFIPGAEDVIEAGDHVTLVGQLSVIDSVRTQFERTVREKQFVLIGGGGDVGYQLAVQLQKARFQVTLLEANEERCRYLASRLGECTVLKADSTRRVDLEEARVRSADAFVAATGDDEDNLICSVEAKELGAKRTLCVVRRPDYANVLPRLDIDAAFSPRVVMAREVNGLLMTSPIIGQSQVGDGDALAVEVEVLQHAPVVGQTVREAGLSRCLIAALIEKECVRTPGPDDVFRPGQTAVLLVPAAELEAAIARFRPPTSKTFRRPVSTAVKC